MSDENRHRLEKIARDFSSLLGRLAVPSWVVPGTIWDNASYLTGKVGEIALCCFESHACLDYDDNDLPEKLAFLPLRWHVHLPLDLPWTSGVEEVSSICLRLRKKLSFLCPHTFVLHAPDCQNHLSLLERFSSLWYKDNQARLLLENPANFKGVFPDIGFLRHFGYGFCLDVAHAQRQTGILCSQLPENASMVHWSCPDGSDSHQSLSHLSMAQLDAYQKIASRIPPSAQHVLEIFDWQKIINSLPFLNDILGHQFITLAQ